MMIEHASVMQFSAASAPNHIDDSSFIEDDQSSRFSWWCLYIYYTDIAWFVSASTDEEYPLIGMRRKARLQYKYILFQVARSQENIDFEVSTYFLT